LRYRSALQSYLYTEKTMMNKLALLAMTACMGIMPLKTLAWDHPGHMTTAVIAFAEIEKARPDLIDKIGLLLMKHPSPAPFWVATVGAKGKERTRRMFIEASRWPDDAKFTHDDKPTWHTARWPILAEDAPPEAKALVDSRNGRPVGNALEALALNAGMLANPESQPFERALALSWVMHIMGDLHQPLHVSDLISKDFPSGNAAGALAYVWDPLADSAMPLHILWDSNTRRSTALDDVDGYAQEIMKMFPRSSLPELSPFKGAESFREWAQESHQVAKDWAYDLDTIPDPDLDSDSDRIIANMARYILEGVSHVEDAPAVPDEYWSNLQQVVPRRMALAGYRIADIILNAADELDLERELSEKIISSMPRMN
jgi:hypothetical protein